MRSRGTAAGKSPSARLIRPAARAAVQPVCRRPTLCTAGAYTAPAPGPPAEAHPKCRACHQKLTSRRSVRCFAAGHAPATTGPTSGTDSADTAATRRFPGNSRRRCCSPVRSGSSSTAKTAPGTMRTALWPRLRLSAVLPAAFFGKFAAQRQRQTLPAPGRPVQTSRYGTAPGPPYPWPVGPSRARLVLLWYRVDRYAPPPAAERP